MKQSRRFQFLAALVLLFLFLGGYTLLAWTALPVADDPLVRMPGTQPGQVTNLEAPNRCLNCHSGYDPAVEPGSNWMGSMMAQSARDFLFWACMTVAGQDSVWALGNPNAIDLCERCHFPKGWLEGRSDPPNASAMTGADYDGVQCDFCHNLYDPFFEGTHNRAREGDLDGNGTVTAAEWQAYWDETNASGTPSNAAAALTYAEDETLAAAIILFNGDPFFNPDGPDQNMPFSPNYTENGGGQYFVSPNNEKRASFADANGRHAMFYSRYTKSKYYCSTCHDVSNPALANLGQDGTSPLTSESQSAYSYFHVERTFSEFMLSDYGQEGGSPGMGPYAPDIFTTSQPGNAIATCQDCHMPDAVGKAADMKNALVRPDESVEHPQSGQPVHDLTGGNAWVGYVLASSVPGSANHDPVNDGLLNQGPAVLTLDLTQGDGFDPAAILRGVDRAKQQLLQAAAIEDLAYNPATGAITFRVQNQTGHKLISGFPEGRRMFVGVEAYAAGELIYEVNPYDNSIGTLKGLPADYSPNSPSLGPAEAHVDELVYEMHPTSSATVPDAEGLGLTGEIETFHFALATGRYKDNRIPPKGFDLSNADARKSLPVWHGEREDPAAPWIFTADEYLGGYDAVDLTDYGLSVPGADYVEVTLYYQTTSREYIEFLRDEINGIGTTLPETAYIVQTDPFFTQMKAWGDTIWQLWDHNKNVDGAAPFEMASASVGASPPPELEFTLETQSVSEGVGSVVVTVELNETSELDVTAPFTVSGTATGGSDHSLVDGTFSITGNLTDSVTFDVLEDDQYERVETIVVTLGPPSNATLGSHDQQVITITDNDSPPEISFSSPAYTVGESGGSATITATLTGSTDLTATVNYATSDGTAQADSDYTAASGTLTFAPGETEQTFLVPILDDGSPESDETVDLSLSGPVSATVGTGSAVLTIVDDDAELPSLSIGDASASEGGGTITFTVSLSAISGQGVTVDYATANGTATAGDDYVAQSDTLTIPAGEASGQIVVTLVDDALDEPSETFVVNLSNPGNATIADGLATGTIQDDDPAPTLSIGDASASEGNGTMTFTVFLSAASGREVTVDYATANGTATAGDDYVAQSDTLTIPAGEASGQIVVTLVDDALDEPSETFLVNLSSPGNATIGDGQATGTIQDDDPTPTLSIGDVGASEGDGTMTFTVSLSAISGQEVQVTGATINGTATAGADFTLNSGILNIPAGAPSGQLVVDLVDDSLDEPAETFLVVLSGPINASIADDQATGTITDNDPAPTLAIADASASEDGGTLTFTVSLSAISGQEVTVDYATADGTATAGDDYVAQSDTLTIPAGEASGQIVVTLVDDALDELSETFLVDLSNPGNATIADGQATGTITDNDPAPTLSIGDASASENHGTLTFSVSLSATSGREVTVDYATANGTATAGDDYVAQSDTLTIPAGEASGQIVVTLVDDALDEPGETFLVNLSNPGNATIGDGQATGTIQDDDPMPKVGFDQAAFEVAEAGGTATITVALSSASAFTATVDYATSDGTGPAGAEAGTDYVATSGTLTFTPGITLRTFAIPILDDGLDEEDETVDLSLSSPAHASLGLHQAILTIVDDEGQPTLSIADASADEGDGTMVFDVALSFASALTVTVDYASSDGPAGPGGAVAGADYSAVSGTLEIPAGVTHAPILVPILQDDLFEGDQVFIVELSAPANAGLTDALGQGTIRDDDGIPVVSFSAAAYAADENVPGGTAAITVTLSGATAVTATVDYETADGTAGPADYAAISGTLVFTPGVSSRTLHVAITDDLLDELDETVLLSLADPGKAQLGLASASLTIRDDDLPPAISVGDVSLPEADTTMLFPVNLAAPSGLDIRVEYATYDVGPAGATAGADYVAASGVLTLPAGSTSASIPVTILDDLTYELDEPFGLDISAPGATPGDLAARGTILDNDEPPQIQFETGAYSVGEGAGTVVLTVTLTGPTALTATVQYATSDGPPPASATAGADYVAASDTLTFLPGQTQQPLTITVLDDSQPEANEFFVVSLSDATHSTLGDRNPATVRINDDDGYRVFLPLAIRSAQPAAKARAQPILGLRSSRR